MRARPLMPMPPIPTKWIRAGAGGRRASVESDLPSLPTARAPTPPPVGDGRGGLLPSPRSEGRGAGDGGSVSGWRSAIGLVRSDRNVGAPLFDRQCRDRFAKSIAPVEFVTEKAERRAAGREQ